MGRTASGISPPFAYPFPSDIDYFDESDRSPQEWGSGRNVASEADGMGDTTSSESGARALPVGRPLPRGHRPSTPGRDVGTRSTRSSRRGSTPTTRPFSMGSGTPARRRRVIGPTGAAPVRSESDTRERPVVPTGTDVKTPLPASIDLPRGSPGRDGLRDVSSHRGQRDRGSTARPGTSAGRMPRPSKRHCR